MNNTVNIVTLGCAKNLVDSEFLGYKLEASGYSVAYDAGELNHALVVINTCGFITDAKEESVNTIMDYVDAKNNGAIDKIYVVGCLSQRYLNDLPGEIPEVDQFFGVNSSNEVLQTALQDSKTAVKDRRKQATPVHYAYLKVSDGCNRNCSFCAIPIIKGNHKSVPMDDLVEQAARLAKDGVKELILIAQDLSVYGMDLYKSLKLSELLSRLSDVEGIEWIRLHYLYPLQFPEDILSQIRDTDNICNYIDIPLQHISNPVLQRMKRGNTKRTTYNLLNKIRRIIPGIAIRTTFMVGFPGETEEEFNELLAFVKEMKFERMGVFTYSHEEDTNVWKNYRDDVPEEVKQERYDILMNAQREISRELNYSKTGDREKVLIDGKEDGYYIGRTQYDSPEVDGEVLIPVKDTPELQIGSFYRVKIDNADEYDLFGVIDD